MPASPNKPTAAATPRGAADELRIRKIAEKCEDKAFKFAQQPVIGQPQSAAPPPAPRAPRLSEVRQAASARPSRPRQGGVPARAAASSVRAHGLWAGNDALLPHVAGVLGTEVDLDAGIDAAKLLRDVEELVAERWRGEPREVLVDAFSLRTAYQGSADASKDAVRT